MNGKMKELAQQWKELGAKAKNREFITDEELLTAYRDTYCLGKVCQKQSLIPKAVYGVMMGLDQFTYYATCWDDDYLREIYTGVCELHYGLKQLFFNGEYQTDYFVGQLPQEGEPYRMDLTTISLAEFTDFLEKGTGADYSHLELVDEGEEPQEALWLPQTVARWEGLTCTVLNKKELPQQELMEVLKETYQQLRELCNQPLVPKEVSRLFLEMESFLYFAFLMEEKEVETDFYQYATMYKVVEALKDGFFAGEYPCNFPKLQWLDGEQNTMEFDLESQRLTEHNG